MKTKTYSRKFARSQWRKTMGPEQFRAIRKNTFRIFTGRCRA